KSGNQPLFEILNLGGGTVTGQHDLFTRLVQGIERVKELLLNPFLAGEELDVINQEHVRLSVLATKLRQLVVLNAVDELVGKAFRGKIGHLRTLLLRLHILADRMEQMG